MTEGIWPKDMQGSLTLMGDHVWVPRYGFKYPDQRPPRCSKEHHNFEVREGESATCTFCGTTVTFKGK